MTTTGEVIITTRLRKSGVEELAYIYRYIEYVWPIIEINQRFFAVRY